MHNNKTKGVGMSLIVLLVLMIAATMLFSMKPQTEKHTYWDILNMFREKQVSDFTIDFGTNEMRLRVTDGENAEAREVYYTIPYLQLFLQQVDLLSYVDEYNAEHPDKPMNPDFIPPTPTPWWIELLPIILLIGAMVVLWVLMLRQAGGGSGKAMNFAKMRPKPLEDGRKVTFKDVAGADEEKEELEEIVEFLKSPSKFNMLGGRVPKGVLLMGPPGTGKTLLARAVAGEAGVPFFSISGSDFVEMFVGVGASRVRDLFDQAKKAAPSIIFIDEIDAVGRHRGAGLGGGHDEREQTLNQLLVEMDGFGANTGVIVIAATNRRDILDPALLRPGRFDRQVVVGYPDVKGREQILKVHTRGKPLAPDVDLNTIAKTTAGFTGADLENIVNEAALLAARRGNKAITMKDVEDATIKVIAGPEKRSHVVSDKEKKLTAYHEAGHAICTYCSDTQDMVHQISIIPRGMAGGYTLSLPTEDRSYRTKREMQEEIVTLLGGRMAEKIVLDDISTGASNDIERATNIARSMVTKYGFSEKLGPIVYGHDQGEVFLGRDLSQQRNYSENVAAEIDQEIREIVDTAYEQAKDILEAHLDELHKVAAYLMEHEKMDGDDFVKLMKGDESVLERSPDGSFIPRLEEEQPAPSDQPADSADTAAEPSPAAPAGEPSAPASEEAQPGEEPNE